MNATSKRRCRRDNGVEIVKTANSRSYLDACLCARVSSRVWVDDGAGAAREFAEHSK